MLKEQLDQKVGFRNFLYRRGYLITTKNSLSIEEYPFYGNWTMQTINDKFFLYAHKEQYTYIRCTGGITAVLIGHAYNPFTMEISENEILDECIKAYTNSESAFFDKISELTGIHLVAIFDNEKAVFVQDCTGMQMCCYGKCNENIYITSNSTIIEDVDVPQKNHFAIDLLNSKSYRRGSKYLPGDITIYEGVFRLGPNLCLKYQNNEFQIERFYPVEPHKELNETQNDAINRIAHLIRINVSLCAKKWKKPAISLSGGTDSRTTFASAIDNYDKFYYYSFESKPQETRDAEAAHNICTGLGLEHTIYKITDNNSDCEDFELFKQIVVRNCSNISIPRDNEIRKYYFLSNLDDFEVELKSWASEIGRASWEKRYGFRLPDKLTARHLSIFQTRFFGEPSLLLQSDKAYKEFMKKSLFVHPMYNYEDSDMFFWEYRDGAKGSIVTTGQNIFNFQVTMPMNNRKIIDMFLWYPHDFRKSNGVHKGVISVNNPSLINVGNSVHNGYSNVKRVLLERVYYYYRTLFYKG